MRNGGPSVQLKSLGDGATDPSKESVARHVHAILEALGEDPSREGLRRTPQRVAEAYRYLLQGYSQNAQEILESAVFEGNYNQLVLVKDIELFSLCEHHLLPFFGKVHVGYIPRGKIVGLSKIPRVVDVFARRLQVQERLSVQIRDALQSAINPLGVAVVIEATHLCMSMRGVEKPHAITSTSAMGGDFLHNPRARAEFMRLIGGT